MVEIAKEHGLINDADLKRIQEGGDTFYFDGGSRAIDEKSRKVLRSYEFLFKMIPAMPKSLTHFILRHSLQRHLSHLPRFAFRPIDFYTTFIKNDLNSRQYVRHYMFQLKKLIVESLQGREG